MKLYYYSKKCQSLEHNIAFGLWQGATIYGANRQFESTTALEISASEASDASVEWATPRLCAWRASDVVTICWKEVR